MADQSRYAELLLNQEAPQTLSKSYWTREFYVICFTLFVCATTSQFADFLEMFYHSSILMGLTLAFVLGCFSSFLGSKTLLIGALCVNWVIQLLFLIGGPLGELELTIYLVFFSMAAKLVQIQSLCVICREWPGQFVKVISIALLFIILAMIIRVSSINERWMYQFNLIAIAVNIGVVVLYLNSIGDRNKAFSTVCSELKKGLLNLKLIVCIVTLFLYFIMVFMAQSTIYFTSYEEDTYIWLALTWFVSAISVIAYARRKSYHPTFVMTIGMVSIISGSVIILFNEPIAYAIGLSLVFSGMMLTQFYYLPQFELLLRKNGVKNLDIACSLIVVQSISSVVNSSIIQTIIEYYDEAKDQKAEEFVNTVFLVVLLFTALQTAMYLIVCDGLQHLRKGMRMQTVEQEQGVELPDNGV